MLCRAVSLNAECWYIYCYRLHKFSKKTYLQHPQVSSYQNSPKTTTALIILYIINYKILCIYTGCIKMIGAVSICHYDFQDAHRSKFPIWNETAGVPSFVRIRNPTPLFSLGLWRNKTIMATPEQKVFCVLQFVKHESVFSVQRAIWRQFNSDPPSPNSIRR